MGKQWKQCQTLFWGTPKSLQVVIAAMKLKDTYSLADSLAGKESACSVGDPGSIPALERSPGGGHGNPLRYSCLENPHGQRSLAGYTVHRVTKSQTQLRN